MRATPFSWINNVSVDLNEVCLHITYLFLKELVFVSDVFLLALLSHENLHSLLEVVSRVFSPKSTPLVIQQSPLLYSANLFIYFFFFISLFILLSLLIYIFFSNRSLRTFFHGFPIPFPFPDSGFHVLVLPSFMEIYFIFGSFTLIRHLEFCKTKPQVALGQNESWFKNRKIDAVQRSFNRRFGNGVFFRVQK